MHVLERRAAPILARDSAGLSADGDARRLGLEAANDPGQSQASRSDRRLQLGLVSTTADLAMLRMDWNALFDRAGHASQVFQTHGFLSLYAECFGLASRNSANNPCGARLAIITARRDGRLALVWPMVECQVHGVKILSWLGEPIAQYGDVVIDPQEAPLAVLRAAYDHLLTKLAPDVIHLRKVRDDASVAPLFASLDIQARERTEAPFVTLAAGGSAFDERQSGKAKKNRRRLLRRLEERGRVEFDVVPANPCAREVVTAGLAQKRAWLVQRGLLSPALADRRVDTFMTAAASIAADQTGCAVFSLRLDGRPIATALGFRCKGRLMLHLITYAAEVEKNGAGVLNLEAILQWAETQSLGAVDLLPPKAEYKLDWADGAVQAGDYIWGTTVRGRLWAHVAHVMVRPRLKGLLERLPLGARQRLAAYTLKVKAVN